MRFAFAGNQISDSRGRMMKDGVVLQWSSSRYYCHRNPLAPPSLSFPVNKRICLPLIRASTMEEHTQQEQQLTAKERRKLRNQRRESKFGYSWREEVEERLSKKTKKNLTRKKDELSLDRLAELGPQWWGLKTAMTRGHLTANVVARSLALKHPELEFKTYAPCVKVKNKLKSGKISTKLQPIFPGTVFLWCVLNKEIYDFVYGCRGVGGFIGIKVGYMGRLYHIPRQISEEDIEKVLQREKEEQEELDKAFEEEQKVRVDDSSKKLDGKTIVKESPKKKGGKRLSAGSVVRVQSGPFAELEGSLKKIHRKTGKATVAFTLFGKDTLVDLDLQEIVTEAT
ncbi:Transcription termination/antitermination protein NusG [Linum perenne]